MLKSFEEYNLEKNFFSHNQKLLIAVSGGVDSMVLANIMLQSGHSFALAHCNYQLRGEESEKDQKLIEEFARGAGISLHVKRIDTSRLVQESASSIQMVAREERYKFFDSLMEEHGYDLTLLAHNADDRIESLLMNILRGTGFRGFQGMPIRRGQYVRPLSFARKNEIREFAKQNQISYREDSSNSEIYYQRNWVRLRLLPMLRNHDTEIKSKLLSFIHQSEEKLPECEKLVSEELN
ncbi:MAG: tRNA lysidine(34) synthetase TilS, partial [Flavobacteriales bacterium]